jgi:exodeoxyribonuclease V gamma subunit
LVTDINLYRPAIEWIFDGGIYLQESLDSNPIHYKIPYSLTDLKGIDNSFLFKGLTDLFNLAGSDLKTKEGFMSIIRNPIFKILDEGKSEDNIEKMESTLEALGVFYQEAGRDSDTFSISYGIKRMQLSTLFESESLKSKRNLESFALESDTESIKVIEIWLSIMNACDKIQALLVKDKSHDEKENFNLSKLYTK